MKIFLYLLSLCICSFLQTQFVVASSCHDKFISSNHKEDQRPPSTEENTQISSPKQTDQGNSTLPEEITDEDIIKGSDAVEGATIGAAIDAITGEEITPESIVTDATIGLGVGAVIRTVDPKLAKEIDDFFDGVIDDIF
ncbi:MAG: hypothetical protein OXN83_04640 [Oligoflexia bacterium]|nr:hypothetical protein [Oligoflexia bacterium]